MAASAVRYDALLSAQQRMQSVRAMDWEAKARIVLEDCHPYQRDFVEDDATFAAALCGRGGGKTTAARALLVITMLRATKARCLYFATTREAARRLMWDELKSLLHNLGVAARYDETRLECTLSNGSKLYLSGADNESDIEKWRGLPFHAVVIDEAASYTTRLLENLIDRIIVPRLGDYGGIMRLIGTPGHVLHGRFYDATRPGSDIHRPYSERDAYQDWEGWSSHHWTVEDAAKSAPHIKRLGNVWRAALEVKAANGWTDDNPIWKREYLGIWAADDTENVFKYRAHLDDGTEWNQWSPEIDTRTRFAQLPDHLPADKWSYGYGLDLGHSDPLALHILAYNSADATGTLYHVFGFAQTGMYAREIAKVLVGDQWVTRITRGEDPGDPGGLFGVTGWPEAIVADTSHLGGALLDELRNVYGITIKPAERKSYFDNVELTNGDLIDGRMKILRDSDLEVELKSLQWAVDDFGMLKKDKRQSEHNSDALVYIRAELKPFFEAEQKEGERPSVFDPPPEMLDDDDAEAFAYKPNDDADYWG